MPIANWPLISLSAGLAVCDAVDDVLNNSSAQPRTQLKWPNDVYLDGRKLAGILVEASSGPQPYPVVGIGINVNDSLKDGSPNAAPAGVRDRAIALCDLAGCRVSHLNLLISVLSQLATQLPRATDKENLQIDWSRRCLLTGRHIQFDSPSGRISGRCRGIDDSGALLIETERGVERFVSGVVANFDYALAPFAPLSFEDRQLADRFRCVTLATSRNSIRG